VGEGIAQKKNYIMSDHFSGPRALAGPAGDICDLYAFPSPDRPGRLVLVMNVLPNADPSAFFSDAIVCRFRLRPLTIAATGLRVFAGMRSDPFFLDFPAYMETVSTGRLAFKAEGANFSYGQNILSVVVEAECAALVHPGGGSLFAVVGETVVAGKLPVRIERVGRPEIKNFILSWKQYDSVNSDMELRDIYNLEDTFHMGKDYLGAYRARLNANLAVFDGFDGKTDWTLDAHGAHPLTELLLADHLVVDVSKPYSEASFIEIERALLHGRTHQTCGGRSLNEDAMDSLATLLFNAYTGSRISDGVNQATVPAAHTFPYLAPPNPPTLATTNAEARPAPTHTHDRC
jgi:hypothetical protein